MQKNSKLKIICLACLALFIGASIVITPASALLSQNVMSWYTTSDTNAAAMATGDVTGDGQTDLVTVGYFNSGTAWNAQITILNAATLAYEGSTSWLWGLNTQVSAIAIGDVNGDGKNEIVTGGEFFDGTRWIAQLIVWNGATLAAQGISSWYWFGNTEISSVAIGNVTGGVNPDIVTGGAFFDGTRWVAQVIVWNSATMVASRMTSWYWTSNTVVNSVAIGSVTGSANPDIVTGGYFNDGTRNVAQVIVWNSATMVASRMTSWYWTSNTVVNSVAIGSVTGSANPDIVTGGYFNDGTRNVAQVIVWNSATMVASRMTSWYSTSNTVVNSVILGSLTGAVTPDIFTAGSFNDGTRTNAEIIDWNAATMTVNTLATWFTTSTTNVNSMGIANTGLTGYRLFGAGFFFDGTKTNAQITVWA